MINETTSSVRYEILRTSNDIGIENCRLQLMRSYENELGASLHWHNAIEINLMLEGTVEYYSAGRKRTACAGELVFANSGDIHMVTNPYKGTYATALILIIPDEFVSRYVPSVSSPHFVVENGTDNAKILITYLQQIAWYMQQKNPPDYFELLIHKELLSILYTLFSRCLTTQRESPRQRELIRDVLDYVSSHYAQELSIDAMANRCGLQKNYFCRWFRQQTGMSFHQYLSRIRLDCALALLITGSHSVLTCALECGFSSEKILIDWCRKIYHCTPQQYRSASRNTEDTP